MKRLLLAFAVLAVSAGGVNAQTTLLPTQALEPGHVEFLIDYNFERWRPNLQTGGTLKNETIESTAALGIGVAKGLQLNLSIPYLWKDRMKVQGDEPGYYLDRDGIGDLTVGALLSTGSREGFMASLGFDVKLDTAPVSEGGAGKTEYTPLLGASIGLGKAVPYLTYQPTLRSDHKAGANHLVSLGSEFEVSPAATIDAKTFADIAENESQAGRYGLDLTAYLEVVKNVYLLPRIGIFYVTPLNFVTPEGDLDRMSDTVGFAAGIGLYVTY